MANELRSLVVDEVSVVDSPANASVDPKTGKKRRHAVVAIWKRDAGAVPEMRPKEEGMKTFEQVLKSATTRDAVVAAVEAQAEVIAKRERCTIEKARAKVWNETGAHEAYEAAPVGRPKRERRAARVTKAEAELDDLARQIARKTGASYPQAFSRALQERPDLYARYEREVRGGETFLVPEPDFEAEAVGKRGGECPECDGEIGEGDAFCRCCGAQLG